MKHTHGFKGLRKVSETSIIKIMHDKLLVHTLDKVIRSVLLALNIAKSSKY